MLNRAKILAALVFALFAFVCLSIMQVLDAPEGDTFTPPPPKQERFGVRKDIWVAKDGDRVHYRIESPRSTLLAIPKKKDFRFVEHLEGMHAVFQYKIENGEQHLRAFNASSGIYDYSRHLFNASSVNLLFFRAKGTDIPFLLDPNEAYLQGVAEHVELTLDTKNPDFKAEKFKAQVKVKE